MRHNHVFVLKIFKILHRYNFSHFLVAPRVFIAGGNIFIRKVRGLEVVTHIMCLCVFNPVAFRYASQSCLIFSTGSTFGTPS